MAPLTPGDRRCLGSRTGRAGHSEAALAPRDGRGPGHFAERRWLTLIAALSGYPVVKIDTEAERIYATVASERQIPGDGHPPAGCRLQPLRRGIRVLAA